MLPIRLETERYASGFKRQTEAQDTLVADPESLEPLTLETVDLENPLFVRFINCNTDDEFITFANRFSDHSPLPLKSLRREEILIRAISVMSIGAIPLEDFGIDPMKVANLLEHVALRPTIRHVDGASRLVLIATSTADFMHMELATAFEAGAKMADCAHCGRFFLFGPHTGRRSHGRFCADRCRVAAMRARNAKKGQGL